ncbi:MAG: DNA replication and repair protein RecF [Caldilineaceae bacterium SB0662_bin_9]|uniref:DNA replication and repair protein RecF n=1 Tax=Caldilineaceae bacterium SB0662_bin_9 TaxID=2605258 RepID=A0A6B1DVY6_9CHLR|nr:DNA replication and repair protein RecF [Caldilineaceae bacterium SB0662_bin_9]
MVLRQLELKQFRNFRHVKLDFTAPCTLVQGPNGAGKTNLLDAICFLALSKSLRSQTDRQSIHDGLATKEPQYFDLRAETENATGTGHVLRVFFGTGRLGPPMAKHLFLDGAEVTATHMLGHLKVVLVEPEDTRLVSDGPKLRRRALDVTLCQLDAQYMHHLVRYRKVLANRNALLAQWRGRTATPSPTFTRQMAFLDEQLAEEGVQVMRRRAAWIQRVSRHAEQAQAQLTANGDMLSVRYRPSAAVDFENGEGTPEASDDAESQRKQFRCALEKVLGTELERGHTMAGPHRDDVMFLNDGRSLGKFGSRGQQRTGILAWRLAEAQAIRELTGEFPLLLLDDVMSELDASRRMRVYEAMADAAQVVAATPDWGHYPEAMRDTAQCLEIRDGVLAPT